MGTSLAVQWVRICLPMQRTRVLSLVWEDSTCQEATKPRHHNYWACAPQQEKPLRWEACAPQLESSPCLRQLEKSLSSNKDSAQPPKDALNNKTQRIYNENLKTDTQCNFQACLEQLGLCESAFSTCLFLFFPVKMNIQTKMCSKCKVHSGFLRLSTEKKRM